MIPQIQKFSQNYLSGEVSDGKIYLYKTKEDTLCSTKF